MSENFQREYMMKPFVNFEQKQYTLRQYGESLIEYKRHFKPYDSVCFCKDASCPICVSQNPYKYLEKIDP